MGMWLTAKELYSAAKERYSRAKDVLFFGDYHAANDTGKRSEPKSKTSSEDDTQTDRQRKALTATARQQRRNFELTQWMINLHLTRVAKFTFQAKCIARPGVDKEKVREFNKALEAYIAKRSEKDNFDTRGRFGRQAWMYMAEGLRVMDGDVFPMFVSDGSVQLLEGDRIDHRAIKNAPNVTGMDVTKGVRVHPTTGRRIAFAVCKRAGKNALEFVRWVKAGVMDQIGYFIRHDQERGISPLATMLNRAQDLYEGFDAMLIKTKMHAMFGIAIQNADMDSDDAYDTKDATTGEAPTSSSEVSDLEFEIKPGLKLETDGQVNTIESKTPHTGYIDWTLIMVQVAMLALDIPFTFFDSRKSSYNARLMDLQRYEDASEMKREQWLEWLIKWARWQVAIGLAFGELRPQDYGLTADDIRFEWLPAPVPFIDPEKEMKTFVMGMAAGVDSPQRWCCSHGRDAMDLAEELEVIQNVWRAKNVVIGIGSPGQELINSEESGDSDDKNENDGEEDDE